MHASGPKEIPDDAVNIIERCVILLFDGSSICSKVDHARRKSVPEEPRRSKYHLPEQIKTAVYQGGHIWEKTVVPDPVL